MDIFLAHCLGLLWLSLGTACRVLTHPGDRLLATALLSWGNLTATRLLLGLTDRLDQPAWIVGTSLTLAFLPMWSWLRPAAASAVAPVPAVGPDPKLMLGVGLTLVPLAAFRLSPFYLEQPDDRELLNATAWLLSGLALYRLARLCTIGANAALTLSWLGLVAGLVVAPQDSVARALPAIAGVLACLVFVRQWKQHRHLRHALLGALAALLVVGGLSGHLRPDLRWSGPPTAVAPTPPFPPDAQRLFVQDLVQASGAGPVLAEGLRPAEGPFPRRDLPRFRSVRQPVLRLVIPPQSGLARLRVSISLGVLQRDRAEVLVRFNGQTVKPYRLTSRNGWLDDTLDLAAGTGENVLEFADAPRQQELDWRDYLERYSDVMRYLVTYNIPLETGALEHYEFSGKPEGRIMNTREIPSPVRGAYFYVFRSLVVEGRR